MPRGKYVNHKGRSRRFTSPEELQQDSDSEEGSSSGEEHEEGAGASTSKSSSAAAQNKAKSRVGKMPTSSEDESDESEDDGYDRDAKKGVASLIEIENPNRAVKKATQKVNNLSLDGASNKPELTRREREQLEKQKAKARYEKLHAAGKTTEAKADLARLALVRQQRAEAAAKREAEKKVLDDKKAPASGGGKA